MSNQSIGSGCIQPIKTSEIVACIFLKVAPPIHQFGVILVMSGTFDKDLHDLWCKNELESKADNVSMYACKDVSFDGFSLGMKLSC